MCRPLRRLGAGRCVRGDDLCGSAVEGELPMDAVTKPKRKSLPLAARAYPDLHDHIRALDKAGLLITVDRPINKDTEMHPSRSRASFFSGSDLNGFTWCSCE
jgi:hypothetical protein